MATSSALTWPQPSSLAERVTTSLAERLLSRALTALPEGELEVRTAGGQVRRFGRPAPDGLRATIDVVHPRMWRRVLAGGTLGAGESYVDGDFETDDLTALIRLFVRNRAMMGALDSGLARGGMALARVLRAARENTRAGSRRNIRDHYDLGNDLFACMLDPTMTYSAAVFEPPTLTLEQASLCKLDRLLERLELSPSDRLLEIGTGWGSMALRAAERGARVVTTTISTQQATLARQRIAAAGLSERVQVLEVDYRDLQGQFDKVVSIEMVEAVGARHLPRYFAEIAARLVPGGRLALQAITIPDHELARHQREADFIQRHVFPGSSIPTVTSLVSAAGRARLRLRHLEDITPHYTRTLNAWRRNLAPHRAEVVARYGERFWRTWDYYLCECEGAYAERYLGCVQLLFEREPA